MRKTKLQKKRLDCWHCALNGYNILDEFGCCKRCGTNLKKYPTRNNHPYPNLDDKLLAREVLGIRKQFRLPKERDEFEAEHFNLDKLPKKYNPLQKIVHWTDKDGVKRLKRVNPLCSECGNIATHLVVRRRKNGAKVYLCDKCYNKNPEWETDDVEDKTTRAQQYKSWMKDESIDYPSVAEEEQNADMSTLWKKV